MPEIFFFNFDFKIFYGYYDYIEIIFLMSDGSM